MRERSSSATSRTVRDSRREILCTREEAIAILETKIKAAKAQKDRMKRHKRDQKITEIAFWSVLALMMAFMTFY